MRLTLFSFGKMKTAGLRETADYYQRLLRPWIPLEAVELKPLSVPDKSAEARLKIQTQEGKLLTEKIKTRMTGGQSLVLLLDEKGKALSTLGWASELSNWESRGIASVSLCLGSSLGFSEEVRRLANGSLSLGPQTLSHELARVVLLEQLYRATSYNKGHPYHNEGS